MTDTPFTSNRENPGAGRLSADVVNAEATMSRPEDRGGAREGRREFLKGAAVAGGAVTVAVAAGNASAAAPQAAQPEAGASDQGYRETAHVRAYYKTAAM